VTKYLKPDPIAGMRVTAVKRADVQSFVDRLRRKGPSASTIANKLDPIRVVFRRAIHWGEITVDPTKDLELPAVRGRRDRVADRSEAAELVAALPGADKAFWRRRSTAASAVGSFGRCAETTSSSTLNRR
jgi:site-specific recombinase XerC